MRPVALELAAFGPYLEKQRIDFERLGEHGLFLIHGRTGAGKSSVLDALCYALFGKSTGDERRGEDFVSTLDLGAETKVVLDFEHLGVRYRVTRSPTQSVAKKRGAGVTNRPTDASLVNLATGEVLAARAGDVTRAVQEMLRCDVSQFRQTVVLPQGDFRRVVTEHKARRDILASIFRTQRFADLAERLSEAAKQLARDGQALQEQRRQLLEDNGAENAADLERLVSERAAVVKGALAAKRAATAKKDSAVTALAAGQALLSDFEELAQQQARAQELTAREPAVAELRRRAARAEQAAKLVGQRDELDRRRDERDELQEQCEKAREAVAGAETQLAAGRDAQAELEKERPRLEEAERSFQRLRALSPQVGGLAKKLERRDRLNDELELAGLSLETALGDGVAQAERERELERERDGLQPLGEQELAADDAGKRARRDLEQADAITGANDRLAHLYQQMAELQQGPSDPLALLSEAVKANAPGLLAGELAEGQPCSVCGSVHHPAPSVHGDVDALRRAFQEFGDASAQLAGLRERHEAVERDVRTRCAECGWDDGPPPRQELVQRLADAEARVEEIAAAKRRLAAVREELEELKTTRVGHAEVVEHQRARLADLRADLKGVEGEVKGAMEGLAREDRDPDAFAEALEEARALSERLRGDFEEVAERVTRAGLALDRAKAAYTGAEGHLATAVERLASLEEAFARKLAKAGFSGRADFDAAVMPEDELTELQSELKDHADAVQLATSTITRLSGKLKDVPRPDLDGLAEAVTEARRLEAAAEEAWTTATAQHARVKQALERLNELERLDAGVAARRLAARKLSDLATGNLTGHAKVTFETFVLRSIFVKVLAVGNRHLRHMTGGRYTLLLSDEPTGRDTGLELDVRDNSSSGETRPVHTLSGGEGFLASLALALGLSEISQRESGGVELGALFIDEGFGSLDAQALDQAIDILRGLEQDHRMVGIISHVEDLKRRIPVQLLVLDAEVGSRVEMRVNA